MRSLLIALLLAVAPRALAQDQLPPGHAPVSDEALRRALGEGPPVASSAPSPDLPAGVVEVLVVDAGGRPQAGVRVLLGALEAGAHLPERAAQTGGDGRARFTDVGGGNGRAYRVKLEHEGARYLTTPFTMQPDHGQTAMIRRLATTTDARRLLVRVGQTIVEWKPERVHLSQAVELMNLGESMHVFAGRGLFVPLPAGALAFEAEQTMNDQRMVPVPGGFRLQGSLPPGRVQLHWTFDLPLSGSEATIQQRIPFAQTAAYQVIVDAQSGMELDVRGFPDARFVDYQGKRYLVTETERTPEDPPLESLRIRVRGIPGPGPGRWIAIAVALVLAGLGIRSATRSAGSTSRREERARSREELLDTIDQLAAQKASGEVGEQTFEKERERIVEQLALLARADALEA